MRLEVAERIKVIRAVLDTNIFLRSLIRKGNISDKTDENLKKQLFEYGIEVLNALEFYQKLEKILTFSTPFPVA